ncbi:MAG TPA: ankyrin repeat domain-containing protein [Verrucomicrobiae bacterium]|nr:ankyrin repeat domain-containing protein [Verrucomicrobiae bacterium]
MSKPLPERPSLEQLKRQAKELLKAHRAGDSAATARFRENHPAWNRRPAGEIQGAKLSLHEAQLAIAREHGFPSWPKLKEHIELLARDANPVEAFKAAVLDGDVKETARVLERHPLLKSKLNDALPDHGFGTTPLLAAVGLQNKELIDLLLRSGADINGRSHWWAGGFGVLDDDHGLAAFLIERGAVVDAHAAARMGMLDRLKELVAADPAVVHARGGDGKTPLHFASTVEIADFLLAHGADLDARDIDHESTPAQHLLREQPAVARHLVRRGCHTDILMAASLGELEIARKHLEADPACVNTTVNDRYFPKKNPRAGGHIYIWTVGQGKTAHVVARENGHETVFQLLMERSPALVRLAAACAVGGEALARQILAGQPDITRSLPAAERGRVVDAAVNENIQAVRLLLEAGWPVDAVGHSGGTPLHWAGFHGNVEMARVILAHRPPLELRDAHFNATPLGWAIHGSEHGWRCRTGNYPATVEAILAAGAKLPDKPGGTGAVQEVLRAVAKARGVSFTEAAKAAPNPREILEAGESILLVDWPTAAVPRALLEAGLTVFGYSPAGYSQADLSEEPVIADDCESVFPPKDGSERGHLVFHRLATKPKAVDIVAVYRPADELPGIVMAHAVPLKAKALWMQRPVESDA